MKSVWKIWCEYDIGQDQFVFKTKAGAELYAMKAIESIEHGLYVELEEENLVGYEKITLR